MQVDSCTPSGSQHAPHPGIAPYPDDPRYIEAEVAYVHARAARIATGHDLSQQKALMLTRSLP